MSFSALTAVLVLNTAKRVFFTNFVRLVAFPATDDLLAALVVSPDGGILVVRAEAIFYDWFPLVDFFLYALSI